MATPRLKKNGREQCYYESLGVERTVGDDELKQAYRKLAMQWHPDKNADNIEEATEMFKVIQNAYQVLSDPNERSWYDRHREQILRGAGPAGDDSDDDDLDLFPFFSPSSYKGFGDDEDGFYTVYAEIFAEVDGLEREQGEDDEDTPARARGRAREAAPGFGTSASEWADVRAFYNYWLGFCTRRPMYSRDKWDLREAPNRFMRRAMEKENKKERQTARREYSAQVRSLVEFARKRDRRVHAHNERADAEAKEREAAQRARREEEQAAYDARRSRVAAELAAEDDDEVVQRLQAAAADLGIDRRGKKGRRAVAGGDGDAPAPAGAGGAAAAGGEEDSEMLFCPACNKDFRSLAQLQNHERSKKHLEKAAELRLLLEGEEEGEEEEEGGSEGGEGEEESEGEEEEGEEEEGEEEAEESEEEEEGAEEEGAQEAQRAQPRAEPEPHSSDESEATGDSDDAGALEARAWRKPARHERSLDGDGSDDGGAELFWHLSVAGGRRDRGAGRPAAAGAGAQEGLAAGGAPAESGAEGEAPAPPAASKKGRRRAKNAEARAEAEKPAPAAPPAAPDDDDGPGSRGRAARKPKKGKGAAAGEGEQDFECKSCGAQFATRNRLFQHIKTDCHPAQLAALRKQ